MKIITPFIIYMTIAAAVMPQTKLTLDECQQKARENYPLIKQKEYIVQSRDYSVNNIWKGYFPQITINGQATYQNDVTAIPISLPGLNIPSLSKDQYKAYADVSQVIYDGGIMKAQSGIQNASAEADDRKIEVELIKLKDRVNQIYFGILLLDEQLIQTGLVEKDIRASLDKLIAAFENGTATKSNVDVMKAELIKVVQKNIEQKSSRKSLIDMLALLINMKIDDSMELEIPVITEKQLQLEIVRPEISLFNAQEKLFESQNGLTLAKILPKASLFFQGGYGKPTLNMLNTEFDWFYIAGAKITWPLSGFYIFENENEINELNKKSVEAQKEAFLLNISLSLKQYSSEVDKLLELVKYDNEIIEIRSSVKEAAKAQLENGVITASDYIRELNAEDQAKQNLAVHKIQLLLAQQNYLLAKGY